VAGVNRWLVVLGIIVFVVVALSIIDREFAPSLGRLGLAVVNLLVALGVLVRWLIP
jgi:hypothetical protein